ncbi:MAG: PLDc N-terminal domain-containing protein, partial [Lachnospiraceae bacterium]|nr:PLDc N-terminal domain-containing protein [Lachnospiraceae bacterium]
MLFKKVRKVLRSRYFWGVLGIVLELAQLLAVFTLLFEYFLPITVLGILFHIGILLYVINRDEIPEFKIPWLIILFLLPVIGAFIYMLFTSTGQSKKEYLKFEDAHRRLLPYLEQSEAEREELKKMDADARSQAAYLYHAAGMPCGGGYVTYYPLGEKFHAALLESLEQAEKFIFMEYFIIQPGKMWNPIYEILKEKAAQGVKVYLMYDDFGCMVTLPERYYEDVEREGIHCIPANKFKPVLSRIHNNRDHRKITVIDGKIGFTGGVNLADEYINEVEKYGHWKDTAVKIEGEAVRNLTVLFLEFWNMQVKEPMEGAPFLYDTIPSWRGDGIVIPYGDGPEPMYNETIGKNVYLNMIHAAREYLYLTTPYLICDHELMNALKLAAKRGVDVRLITPHIP